MIGTQGPASGARIHSSDWAEGIGQGAELQPQSLYLDQLTRRIGHVTQPAPSQQSEFRSLIIYDDFDEQTTGSSPDSWDVIGHGGDITIDEMPGNTDKSMRLNDWSDTENVNAVKTFESQFNTIVFEFDTKADVTDALLKTGFLYSGDIQAVMVYFDIDGRFSYFDGKTKKRLQNYDADTWYKFKLVIDVTTSLYDIYIDDMETPKVNDVQFSNPVPYLDKILFGTNPLYLGKGNIDNIKISPADAAEIERFSFVEQTQEAIIDPIARIIEVEVGQNTSLSELRASILLSAGAKATIDEVTQVSGETVNDFTHPVIYTITAADGTAEQWTVTVSVEQPELSSNANLIDLQVEGETIEDFAVGTLAYSLAVNYDVTTVQLIAVTEDPKATVMIIGGDQLEVGNNTFTLTVTAEDGSVEEYTLTILRAEKSTPSDPSPPKNPSPPVTPSKPEEPITEPDEESPEDEVPGEEQHNPEEPDSERPTILTDISEHWAESTIQQLAEKGIINGYPDGTFRPEAVISRVEFTMMLMKAISPVIVDLPSTFTDQHLIGDWARQAVSQAVQAGIINGYGDGSFRPDVSITRSEMAVMIVRAIEAEISENEVVGFNDDHDIPEWASAAIATLQQAGLMKGKGNNRFAPLDPATRAEAATMIMRVLKVI